jgi:pseudaminic acid cytidylyltransferase
MRKLLSLCIIPARGGSKRIPRKNIRSFRGKPIIAHIIGTALAANCFDEVMVSTDDDEIAGVAHVAGAQVPFKRSPQTSGDDADTLSVLYEVSEQYRLRGREFEICCCIYPTAVLTRPENLREGRAILAADSGLAYVVPVIPFCYPIQRGVAVESGRLRMFHPEHYTSRSQDLPKAYHDAGQWYWFRTALMRSGLPILGPQSGAVVISEMDAQDIDNEDDWRMAELKFTMRCGK